MENEKCLLMSNFLLHFETFRNAFILVQRAIRTVTGQLIRIDIFQYIFESSSRVQTQEVVFTNFMVIKNTQVSWDSFNIRWTIFKTSDTHKVLLKIIHFCIC